VLITKKEETYEKSFSFSLKETASEVGVTQANCDAKSTSASSNLGNINGFEYN